MHEILQTFSKKLKARRKALGMTQRELAEKISYSEKAVSKWESGAALPPTALLPLLSTILGVSVDELLMSKNDVRYYLGIDGGGSKTEFLLVNTEGVVVNRLVLGASNSDDHGKLDTEAVLNEGILRVLADVPISEVSVFAGISGSRAPLIRDFLKRFDFARCDCGDSVSCILEFCDNEKEYVAVNIGVGSIVYTKYADTYHRGGGYGYLFGDECGGYAIGRDAIAAVLADEDGSGEATLMKEPVLEELKVDSVFDSFYDLYRKSRGEIAEYALYVFRAYRDGDKVAKHILCRHTHALAQYIMGTLSDFNGDSITVYLFGGVTGAKEYIVPLLREYLADFRVKCNIEVRTDSMVEGALRKAGLKVKIKKNI